jgi:mannose-1-phosphate guanylyltransferase / phosphomannomutase
MKAIIMAGGKGTRLSPLTCHLPKPMVPLLDCPCMEYIVDLLKKHGITDIGVTLQYLPHVIKGYFGDGSDFGVRLHYFDEVTPLGTAGSVKNAEKFLDETFLVISGDAFTDFDLSAAISFHKQKQSIATLILTRVDVPLEYGVVMTEEDGKIERFLEKPSWSEVFSDTVNTGIYVLEPSVLDLFDKGQKFDFSKDLFPALMNKKQPIYGYVAGGYWSDIGNLVQYRQTQVDMLLGLTQVKIRGTEVLPGVWLGKNTCIHDSAHLEGPTFVGEGSQIKAGAKIGPLAIIGRSNRIEQDAHVERSVLWNGCCIGKGANLSGTSLCSDVHVGEAAIVGDNTVVGEKSRIGEQAVLKPEVKVWPGKFVGSGTILQSSLIWGNSVSKSLFGTEGISGILNVEMTPEVVGRITAAYGASIERGKTVSVSCDHSPFSMVLKYSAISSLLAIGISVRDVGKALAPIARFECRNSESVGAIHIRNLGTDDHVLIQFFDQEGLPIDKEKQRKIENCFLQEDFIRPTTIDLGKLTVVSNTHEQYTEEVLSRINTQAVGDRQFKILIGCENLQVFTILKNILDMLNCKTVIVMGAVDDFAEQVTITNSDLGIQLDRSAQEFKLFTEEGQLLREDQMVVLQTLVGLKDYGTVPIPVTAPAIIEEITNALKLPSVKTKTRTRSLLEVGKRSSVQVFYDGLYTLASVLEYLAHEETSLKRVMNSLPKVHTTTDFVACPPEAKGRVMRRLIRETRGQQVELVDGVKVRTDDSWALILPDHEKALFKLITQGTSSTKTEELRKIYKNKIVRYQEQ